MGLGPEDDEIGRDTRAALNVTHISEASAPTSRYGSGETGGEDVRLAIVLLNLEPGVDPVVVVDSVLDSCGRMGLVRTGRRSLMTDRKSVV